MDRYGGSRKFSKLDGECREYEEDQDCSVDTDDKLKPSPGSPKSGKRILDSLTSKGSPRRRQEDDNNNHESPTRVPASRNASVNQLSPRQRMVDAVIDSVATSPESTPQHPGENVSPSWKIQPMYDKSEAEMILLWKIQPVHDDALTSLSENGTEVMLAIPREEPSLDAERSETALQKDSSIAALYAPLKDDEEKLCVKTRSSNPKSQEVASLRPPLSGKRESSAALPDNYTDIELLVARVKRLDALSKAGEVAAAASVDGEGEPTCWNVKMGMGGSPCFAPIDRSQQDSSGDYAKSQVKESGVPTPQELVDGSNDFQVIYRRRPGSPGSNLGTIAASSIASMSSFGVPTTTIIHKPLLISKSPSRESRSSAKQLTAHPFFWKTHPRGTFTSYGPNLPKTMLSPLQHKSLTNQDMAINPPETAPSSSIVVPLSIMKTVEEKEENDPDTTFCSRDTDPTAMRPQDRKGLSKVTPPTKQRSPSCRHLKLRENNVEIQAPRVTNGSSIHFEEVQFSTSWTGA